MEHTSPNSDLTGLLNVGRQSIRRLSHAVKKRRESAAGETSEAPVRAPTENTAAPSKKKYNARLKKTSKKNVFPTLTREQAQTTSLLTAQHAAAGEREATRQVKTRRRSSGRRSSCPATSTTNSRSLVSWPFRRAQGRLDIQGRPLQHASLTKAARGGKRDRKGSTASSAGRTNTKNTCGQNARQEGPTTPSREQQASRNTSGGGDEESDQRLKRKRRRSYSDAVGYPPARASEQTHVVAAGLATPRRPKMQEKEQRCTPKKLNVKEEEFLSLKKKLEWELTLGLYCRQKKEFMEINKDMYE